MSMEARILYAALMASSFLSLGASYRTQNFIVDAKSPRLAQEIGDTAEANRRDLAKQWLGSELPPWSAPCPIRADVAPHLGAGGATSFMFERGRPFGWRMTIQGSRERVLDSVLPHEVTHTIFATHFGRPLPRWADEGACTTVEHFSEKRKQHRMLYEFLTTNRGIAFNEMFAMKEYPSDIMPLYSQGYSLARFLIAQGGQQKFIQYVGDGMDWNNWTAATKKHYGFQSLSELQVTWLDWVRRGCPAEKRSPMLVSAQPSAPPSAGQSSTDVNASFASLARDRMNDVNERPVPSQPPAGTTSPTDGWYAQQSALAAKGQQTGFSDPDQKMDQGDNGRTQIRSATRPQDFGRPGKIVIENVSTPQPGGLVPLPYRQSDSRLYNNGGTRRY